jgi:hypothetical protein
MPDRLRRPWELTAPRESIAELEAGKGKKQGSAPNHKPPSSHPETKVVQRSMGGKTLWKTNLISNNER